jgi:hypothetical protein
MRNSSPPTQHAAGEQLHTVWRGEKRTGHSRYLVGAARLAVLTRTRPAGDAEQTQTHPDTPVKWGFCVCSRLPERN